MKNTITDNIIDATIAQKMHPQTLAFMGDAVHSLYVRRQVILSNKNPRHLHAATVEQVKASGQSSASFDVVAILTESELAVFKRARNYKSKNVAKNASVTDYKRATGLEAVLGYLYLSGQTARLQVILETTTPKGEGK